MKHYYIPYNQYYIVHIHYYYYYILVNNTQFNNSNILAMYYNVYNLILYYMQYMYYYIMHIHNYIVYRYQLMNIHSSYLLIVNSLYIFQLGLSQMQQLSRNQLGKIDNQGQSNYKQHSQYLNNIYKYYQLNNIQQYKLYNYHN